MGKDLVAGLTTGVVLVAQAVAYATLAGLPPTAGLYAALVAPVLYALVGRSDVLAAGPTAISSLLVGGALARIGGDEVSLVAHAALLAAMVGLIQLMAATARLHRLSRWVTPTVLRGFLAGAALRIIWSQLPHLGGWEAGAPDLLTAGVGLSALFLLLLPLPEKLRPLGALRTVLVMVLFTALCFALTWPIPQVGELPAGLPIPAVPGMGDAIHWRKFPLLVVPAALIALLSFVEGIGAAAARPQPLRTGRELVALGCANLASSVVRGYPVSGGLSRSAVNARAGATSRVAGAIASGVVALILVVGSAILAPLPNTVLAAVIIAGVLSLIDVERIRASDRRQRWITALAFAITLALGVGEGIVAGALAEVITRRWGPWADEVPNRPISNRPPPKDDDGDQ